jgi:hypothetical protein
MSRCHVTERIFPSSVPRQNWTRGWPVLTSSLHQCVNCFRSCFRPSRPGHLKSFPVGRRWWREMEFILPRASCSKCRGVRPKRRVNHPPLSPLRQLMISATEGKQLTLVTQWASPLETREHALPSVLGWRAHKERHATNKTARTKIHHRDLRLSHITRHLSSCLL